MTGLLALWNASLTLSGVALLGLLLLLGARLADSRRSGRIKSVRNELTNTLLSGGTLPGSVSRLHSEVAADLTAELSELVRGSDRDRLLDCATRLGVVEVLRRRLTSRLAQDRLTAAETLAVFPAGVRDLALAALDDPNRDVRLGAALALAHNQGAPTPAFLAHKLGIGREEHSLLVISLMRDLAESDPVAVQALLTLPGICDETKVAATEALGASRMVENAPLVAWSAEALKHNETLRPRIYRALARLGHPGASEAVEAGLYSQSWHVRTAAGEAAGKIGLTNLIPRLGELLGDEHWWVRLRAGEALAAMGQPGRARLIEATIRGDQLAGRAAKAILAERKL